MPNRFIILAESSPTGIYHVQDGLLQYLNPALARMFGYTVEELAGRLGPLDLVHPEDRPLVAENFRRRTEGGEVEGMRYRFRGMRKDGSEFPVEVHGRLIEHEGKPGVIGTLVDGSERQRAEDELRKANARLEEAQRIAHVGWWERDYGTTRVSLSDEACRIFGVRGVDLPEWHGRWLELIHPEDRARAAEASAAALRGGPRYDVEYRVVRPDGAIRMVHSKGDVTWDRSGRPLRQFGVMQDVTELRQAERELRASEARFRTFVDRATDAFFLHDERLTILDVNRQACDSLGYSREELIGMHPHDFDVGLGESPIQLLLRRVSAGEILTFETRHRRKDGTVFPVEIRAGRFEQEGEHRHLSLVRDITDRKRAEQALRVSEERFRTLVQFSFDVYWESDAQHRFTHQEFAGGLADAPAPGSEIGKTRWEVPYLEPDEEAWRRHRETLDAHLPFRDFELARPTPDGGKRYVSVSGLPVFDEAGRFVGYRGVGRHITERKRSEAALREVQAALAHAGRVATMGQLTAAIAHEVRQPIAAAVTNAQAALRWLDRSPPNLEEVGQALNRIVRDAGRAGDVIARIRALVEKAAPRRDPMPVNEAILDVLGLLQAEIVRHGVTLRTELAEHLPPARGDKVQLQQVVLNLIVNAIEAMDGAAAESPRMLLVRTEAAASGGVAVAVRDSGPGLGPDDPERLFEAFHSTKPHGLGMGLAICRSIVEAHGGRLWAGPNEPRGAVMQFTLPADQDEVVPAEDRAGERPAA